MKTMESELQRLDNELYMIYLRSSEIAKLKWLPNIKPKNDSYNSYPHVKGVMEQIDRLLYEEEENSFLLNSSELYILLCAVLMHDIGKGAYERLSEKDFSPSHAVDSRKLIVKNWADLGLLTKKAAEIVADICWFHDCPDKAEMKELYTRYYIDQFKRTEPIRGRIVGALLFLGDHMDNTFTRTVPPFFKEEMTLDVVGNFRSKIADVRLVRQYKMVKEILDKDCFTEAKDIEGQNMLYGDLYKYLSDLKVSSRQSRLEKKAKNSTLYTIAKNVMENNQEIMLIKDELNIMGMPIKKWLIECDEHLFRIFEDEHGNLNSAYALEPIINLDYCLEVLKGICILSGGIFARQYFRYVELVNFIREEEKNTYKTICAVRRLSLLLKAGGNVDYMIYYDENNWSFSCRKDREPLEGQDQKEIVYQQIKKIICERLGK